MVIAGSNPAALTNYNIFELKDDMFIGLIMGKSWINKGVFDGMIKLYVKQALESAEFMQNLPELTIFEKIKF